MPSTDADLPQPVSAVKPNPRNNLTMFKIFQNVQYNVVQHKKYVKEMIKLYKKVSLPTLFHSITSSTHWPFSQRNSPNPKTTHWPKVGLQNYHVVEILNVSDTLVARKYLNKLLLYIINWFYMICIDPLSVYYKDVTLYVST